jgi:hypothetical protein
VELETLPVVLLIAGMTLLYAAIQNKNPLALVQAALSGKDISSVPPLMADSAPSSPGAVPGTALPGTPQNDGDARTDPPSFDPNRDSILPNYGTPFGSGIPGNGVV